MGFPTNATHYGTENGVRIFSTFLKKWIGSTLARTRRREAILLGLGPGVSQFLPNPLSKQSRLLNSSGLGNPLHFLHLLAPQPNRDHCFGLALKYPFRDILQLVLKIRQIVRVPKTAQVCSWLK